MAHYLTNNEKFHIFSKSPVLSDMAVSQAVNKSGHTVSTNDVWADDVPWFTEVADEAGAITRAADARYNDLILWGSDIYVRKGDKTNGASTGTTFAELWEKHTDLTEARAYALGSVTTQTPTNIVTKTVEIKNASDKVVLKYHVGKQIDLLTTANNANVASTWAARMFIDGKVVDQFVSPTDKVFAGNPSTGYTTLVYTATTASNKYGFVAEGEADGDFVNNAFAGIVQFNQSRTSTHKFAASVFEYVGDKLDATVAALSKAVFGEGGSSEPDEEPTSLTEQVEANTKAITKLNGAANVDGSVLHTVQVAIDGLDNAVDQQGGAGISVVQTNGVVNATVTTATVATDGTITNGSNVVTATDAKTIADTAATAAITAAIANTEGSAITEKIESEIADATLDGDITAGSTSTQLVTAEQVVTYVEGNAKVTLTAGDGIAIEGEGKGTEFIIAVDETIALKTDITAAIDALSATDGVITNLAATVTAAQENAAASEAAAKAAQAAAEAAKGEATAAKTEAAGSKTAAEAASTQAAQSATSSSESAAAAAASKEAAEASASAAATSAEAAATSAEAAGASQTAAAASQTAAEKAAADAASAKTTVEGFEDTLNAASLNKSGTLEGKFTITTEGTVKGGLTKIEITDAGLGKLISDAQTQADKGVADAAKAQEQADKGVADAAKAQAQADKGVADAATAAAAVTTLSDKAINSQSVTGAGVSVTLSGKVGAPTLTGSVTTASYTKASGETPGSWTDEAKVVTGATVKDALADVASAHSKDIQTLQTAINGLTTTGLTREVLPNGQTTANITDPKANVIYLVKDATSETGAYVEYLYVDGTFEAIGTTSTDLSEYAKTGGSTKTIADLATEVATAQGEVDALEVVVSTLSQTHASDKTALENSIKAVSDKVGTDSVAAQIDTKLSALTDKDNTPQGGAGVSLTQTNGRVALTVTSGVVAASGTTGADKFVKGETVHTAITTAEAAAKKHADDAIAALDATKESAGVKVVQTDGAITEVTVTPGSVAANDGSVVTGGAVYTAIKAVSDLVGTTAVATQISDAIAALDSEKSGNGITVTLTDGKVTGVAAATGTVAENNGDVVTGGVVHTAVEAVKAIAEAKIASVVNSTTHLGSDLATTEGTTVTIAPAARWNASEVTVPTGVAKVINGEMFNSAGTLIGTIDDANLIDGTSMFAGNTALATFVGDLGKLTTGTSMFSGCTGLKKFCANLGSLTDGTNMFTGCSLDEESLIYIVDSLPDLGEGTATINVGTITATNANVELTSMQLAPYVAEAAAKGWTLA